MSGPDEELVEIAAKAMREAVIRDAEGEFPRLFDLLGFSGENKAHTVVDGLARAVIAALAPKMVALTDFIAWMRAEGDRLSDACDCDETDPLMTVSAYYHGAATDLEEGERKIISADGF